METHPSPTKPLDVDITQLQSQIVVLEKVNARLRQELEVSRKEAARYAAFIEKANDIIYRTDADGFITFINPAVERVTGYTGEELVGRHYLELIRPDFRDKAARTYGKQFAYKISNTYFEFPMIVKDGREVWIGQQVQLVIKEDQAVGFQAIARDITKQKQVEGALKEYQEQLETMVEERTFELKKKNVTLEYKILERKQVEAALRESEEKYRSILETIEDGYYESDFSGNLTFFNEAMVRIHEYPRDDLLGMNNRKFTDEVNAKKMFKSYSRVYLTGAPCKGMEFEIVTKSGGKKAIENSISLIRDSAGKPVGFRGICRDITELKRAQAALQKTHAQIALLLNSISSILVALSDDNRIIFWNTKAEEQFGILGKEVLGRPLGDLGIHWDWKQVETAISRCRRENIPVGLDTLKFLQTNGKDGILGIRINPIYGEEFSGMVTLIQGANITRRKILEGQLAQAQKLESIGQLAAGIAHEINTPTQYVGDNVRFLQTSFEDLTKVLAKYQDIKERVKNGEACDGLITEVEAVIQEADVDYLAEEIPRAFQQTLEGLNRVTRIVQSMKAFAHPGKEEKAAVDINKAIENTIMVARNEWKYAADITTDLDPGLPLVFCIPGDINQVILNVLVNAAQAVSEAVGDGSGGKGKITISTRHDDSWVEIRIGDTGKGIPVEVRSKIFDPFFTTKEVGKGTGQGLAITHTAVVDRHGGSITFDTEIGRGTTFKIKLPIKETGDAGNQEA